jgi:hypothetical protein
MTESELVDLAAQISYNAITDLAVRCKKINVADAIYWHQLERADRARITRVVEYVRAHPLWDARAIHERWLRYGSVDDERDVRKPWRALDPYDRMRMRLFVAIVRAIFPLGNTP